MHQRGSQKNYFNNDYEYFPNNGLSFIFKKLWIEQNNFDDPIFKGKALIADEKTVSIIGLPRLTEVIFEFESVSKERLQEIIIANEEDGVDFDLDDWFLMNETDVPFGFSRLNIRENVYMREYDASGIISLENRSYDNIYESFKAKTLSGLTICIYFDNLYIEAYDARDGTTPYKMLNENEKPAKNYYLIQSNEYPQDPNVGKAAIGVAISLFTQNNILDFDIGKAEQENIESNDDKKDVDLNADKLDGMLAPLRLSLFFISVLLLLILLFK